MRIQTSHDKSSCINKKDYNQSITMSTIPLGAAGFPPPRTKGTTPGDPGTGSFLMSGVVKRLDKYVWWKFQ